MKCLFFADASSEAYECNTELQMFKYIFMYMWKRKSMCYLGAGDLEELSPTNLTQRALCPASLLLFSFILGTRQGRWDKEHKWTGWYRLLGSISHSLLFLFLPSLSSALRLAYLCISWGKQLLNNLHVRRIRWWGHRITQCQFAAFLLHSFPCVRRHILLFSMFILHITAFSPNTAARKTATKSQNPATWKYQGLLLSGSTKDTPLILQESVPLCTGIAQHNTRIFWSVIRNSRFHINKNNKRQCTGKIISFYQSVI